MTEITAGITSVMALVESMITAITGNAVLVVILAAGFVGLALKLLKKIFRTSKGL